MTNETIRAFAQAIADYVEQAAHDAATDAQDEITSFPAEGFNLLSEVDADTTPISDKDDELTHTQIKDAILDRVALILSGRERSRYLK